VKNIPDRFMKDVAIKNETKHVAHMAENSKEHYLLPLFHEMLLPPDVCTSDMVDDIATLLTNDLSYFKYTN
jgi:hypothetical protein